MKVVGYARTSWHEQREGTYPSVDAQEERLRQFAERTGLTLAKVFNDTGLSSGRGTCAGLVSILDGMEESWQGVLVLSRDRLTNLEGVSFQALPELDRGDKVVLEATDAVAQLLIERRAKGRPKRRDDGVRDVKRRRAIAERLLRGREAGARAGKHQSGPAPFGYRRDYSRRHSDGVLLVPDEAECEIVQLIFREYLRLRSMKRLIKLLDERGYRTRRGKRWSRAGVSWILKNDTYVGRVHFGEIRVKGQHESIISPIVFNKVQKLIRQNNKRNRPVTAGAN